LIKPQFEAGRDAIGKGGIVRDEAARERAVLNVTEIVASSRDWTLQAILPSPIEGGSGNVEYLMGMVRNG
jgi:23S rRNA (cytidine1920-2'-O)/16S rRNA (cytidine1409-2'-O)-methyltransferase